MDYQATLFAPDLADGLSLASAERMYLGDGAWVDVARGFLPASDEVFDTLVNRVPWRADRRPMYDRVVEVPRLVHTYRDGRQLPHTVLVDAFHELNSHYEAELGEQFVTASVSLYRNGHDSVAWHGDRIGRSRTQDTMVAVLSIGDTRRLSFRPRGGGASIGIDLGSGDLAVMGGSCQRTWEHAVLKVAHAGPRISVQFRPAGVF